MAGREALFSAIKRNDHLQSTLKIYASDCRLLEVKILRESLKVTINHDATQSSLNRAIYLTQLASAPNSSSLGLREIAEYDLAKMLWAQGEQELSIQMLRQLADARGGKSGAISVSRPELLADLVCNSPSILRKIVNEPRAIISRKRD